MIKGRTVWTFEQTPPEMFLQTEVYTLPISGPPPYESGSVDCHAGEDTIDNWDFELDVQFDYELRGYLRNPWGEECGTLAGPVGGFLHSDKVPPEPTITATWKKKPAPSSSICSSSNANYELTVNADDLQCMADYVKLYLVYSDDDDGNIVADEFTLDTTPLCDIDNTFNNSHLECKFTLADPNVFACVQYLKIIVFDEKGNWRAKRMYPQGGDIWEPEQLPYPNSITLTFGERGDPENGEYKQWINLDREYPSFDSELCLYKIDKPNHGPLIFMETEIKPALPGITILFDYEDPIFRQPAPNKSPTNQ